MSGRVSETARAIYWARSAAFVVAADRILMFHVTLKCSRGQRTAYNGNHQQLNRCVSTSRTLAAGSDLFSVLFSTSPHLFCIKNCLPLPFRFMWDSVTRSLNEQLRRYSALFQAFADLLLGVFCMPFTLVGQVLRNFVFGGVMCKLISFCQGK
jgi:hypothetical protein